MRSRKAIRSLLAATGGASHKSALEKAIRQAPKGRREFMLSLLKEMQEVAQLKESLEHYIKELEKERTDIAKQARIRVTEVTFPRIIVQIGEVYRMLSEEVQTVVFHLDQDSSQITQELL